MTEPLSPTERSTAPTGPITSDAPRNHAATEVRRGNGLSAQSDDNELDPHAAAALIQQTTRAVSRSLGVRFPVLYAGWGVSWLVGLGAMWLSVRNQSPYRGPSAASSVLFGVLGALALAVTLTTVIRATRGVSGQSEAQGRIFGVSWGVGFSVLPAVDGALSRNHASATVQTLVGTIGAVLVVSLVYMVGAAAWIDWPMFALGLWLAVVAGVGAFTGPVGVLLVTAAAGGGGFLAMAGFLFWRGRTERG
jgi:hypothetical protein